MTDIVERLRALQEGVVSDNNIPEMAGEAAGEIERLRAEVKTLLQEPLTTEQRLCRLREAFPLAEQDGEP